MLIFLQLINKSISRVCNYTKISQKVQLEPSWYYAPKNLFGVPEKIIASFEIKKNCHNNFLCLFFMFQRRKIESVIKIKGKSKPKSTQRFLTFKRFSRLGFNVVKRGQGFKIIKTRIHATLLYLLLLLWYNEIVWSQLVNFYLLISAYNKL